MKHSKYSIVGWFIRQAMEDKTITVFGDGAQERDYIYIDDIVEALLRVCAVGTPGEPYNIGSHERVRFVDMVDTILAEVGSGRKQHVPWPEDYERNETGDYIADTTKITGATDWQPQVSLKEGVKRTVEYYRQMRQHYW
jgi:nucleoside-diphosphate-sugar epimerase